MKKAYILAMSVPLLVSISFFVVANLRLSSYAPRFVRDLSLYTQAQILASKGKEFAKYFLVEAKKQGAECLNFARFHYPSAKDSVRIDYFYPLRECENGRFTHTNADANLSKDNIIIINISVLLNADSAVNEEIFVNKKAFLYPNEEF